MHLDLADDDVELVREVMDSAVSHLTSEIAHTDSRAYRHNLKERRDRLRGVLDLLGSQTPPQRHDQAG
jgi:hypothetical protein